MQNVLKLGAALWVLLASLPALAYETLKAAWNWTPPGLIPGEAGVVGIVYTWPGSGTSALGGATPPTAVEASQFPVQTAQVFFADTDTEAIIVHNKGLQRSFPAYLYPIIVVTKQLGAATDGSFATSFTFGKANTNQVYMSKISAVGSGGTYDVALFFGDGPWMK